MVATRWTRDAHLPRHRLHLGQRVPVRGRVRRGEHDETFGAGRGAGVQHVHAFRIERLRGHVRRLRGAAHGAGDREDERAVVDPRFLQRDLELARCRR